MHASRSDGSEFPMEMVLWRTDAQGCMFYTASIADLLERRDAAVQIERQREALRQSEKLTAMGSLLAGVAHELNNPLAIVMGRASLLEDKCEALPELRADAQRIREAAERCGRIVRTFLNMARRRPSARSPVALNEMVRAAADMLQYGYRTHGIALELSLAEALPDIHADGDQIGQVVMNLLVNAQQALAGAQGARRVRVQTGMEPQREDREPRVWLRVSDNGPGVSEAARDQVFEPFFTTKSEGNGTGLGLAVSRSLAREHGGGLTLEAATALGGACFRLSLPVSGIAATDTMPAALPETSAPLQARVLVVDDEVELADVMREMLEGAGHEVATAESGAVALELLATARFDAIVCDLRMPDMDGAGLWRTPPAAGVPHAVRHRRHALAGCARVPAQGALRCARQAVPEGRPAGTGGRSVALNRFSGHRGFAGGFDHRAADDAVEHHPGFTRLRCEGSAEALFQRQQQGVAHCGVVRLDDTVSGVARTEIPQHRNQRVGPVQQADGRADHRHQALALMDHVATEEFAQ